MKCKGNTSLALLAGLVMGALAGDLVHDIQRDFKMGLFARQASADIQFFTQAIGGASTEPIVDSGDPERPFSVGGDTFTDFQSAANRVCDNQKNTCAQAANDSGNEEFQVKDCDTQNDDCKSAASSATTTSFASATDNRAITTSDAEFDYFCD
ncbi:hypothetical protein F4778DRAFT_400127 [Xylariomycetidae sp. FL2044]|nr:hypothetical protein F4778DRAFT_400127 [Xylariomycetidae sp. FL2044]